MREMMQLFYRQNGMRYGTELLSPGMMILDHFPKNSLFHYLSADPEQPNLDTSRPYLQGYTVKNKVEYILDYSPEQDILGPHRRVMINFNDVVKDWRRKNISTFTIDQNAAVVERNENALVVVNYSLLDVVNKYAPNQLSAYYAWVNRMGTIYRKMNKIASTSTRNQFFFYPIPKNLVGRMMLDKCAEMEFSSQLLRLLGNTGDAGFMLLDLWKFLDAKPEKEEAGTESKKIYGRESSLLALIGKENFGRINLVFTSSQGKNVIVNLGYLNSWIRGQSNTTEMSSVTTYNVQDIKIKLLRFMMTMNALVEETGLIEDEVIVQVETAPEGTAEKSEIAEGLNVSDPDTGEDDGDEAREGVSQIALSTNPKIKDSKDEAEFKAQNPSVVEAAKKATGRLPDGSMNLTASIMDRVRADVDELDKLSLRRMAHDGDTEISSDIPSAEPEVTAEELLKQVLTPVTPTERIQKKLEAYAEDNIITAAEYRKHMKLLENYRASPDPYQSGMSRTEAMKIAPEKLKITNEDADLGGKFEVQDKSMRRSTLRVFNSRYLKDVRKSDMLRVIDSLQQGDVVIQNHQIERKDTVLGSHEIHTLSLKPVDGTASNIVAVLPVVSREGTFMAGGNKYIMRKQRVDIPLRKIAPQIVSLSTYYNKTFVEVNQKVANNSMIKIKRKINESVFDQESDIKNVLPGDVFDNYFNAPMLYSALAQDYISFSAGGLDLMFDHTKRKAMIEGWGVAGQYQLEAVEKGNRVLCGRVANIRGHVAVVMDKNGLFYSTTGSPESEKLIGDIYDILGIDMVSSPVDFAEVRIFSKYVPIGIVLAYFIGFHNLLKLLKVDYRIVEPRKNKQLQRDEYSVSFRDVSYVFSRKQRAASLAIAGFTDYEKVIKLYDIGEFDRKGVYLNLLMAKGMSSIYIRELDMMHDYFIDPISFDILKSRNEPLTFSGLLLRSAEMLTVYTHPDSKDRNYMRERGYERFAGIMYKEVVSAIREYRGKSSSKAKIAISPYKVLNAIMTDNSNKIAEDINPLANLKEEEVVTYAGTGGQDKDSMNKASRAMHITDVGIGSESSVDSSAVGTIFYLTSDPNIQDVRGLAKEKKDLEPANMLSSCVLASPFATNDIMKRIMFITTQQSHTIASPAYRQPYVRTGYEYYVGMRTSSMFSYAAEQEGKVESIGEKGMIVKYADGEVVGIDLGRRYGVAEGTTYPHDIIPNVKVGQKFSKGDVLAYNTKFFEPDFFDPRKIVLKMGGVMNTAFYECKENHEDSCSLSDKLGDSFTSEVTKVKSYVVDFDQNLLEVAKPGTEVSPKDVLMVIEDAITANSGNFGEDALSTLKRLSNSAPRAGVKGKVEKIEVFYHGEKADMSASLKQLADRSDRELKERCVMTNRPVVTGRVSEEYRVSGNPLGLDKAEIRVYINVVASSGVGDKFSFGHQMKVTVSKRHSNEMCTEDGTPVDATFSFKSVAARGVMSIQLLGSTITNLHHIGKKFVSIYEGNE